MRRADNPFPPPSARHRAGNRSCSRDKRARTREERSTIVEIDFRDTRRTRDRDHRASLTSKD